MARHIPLGEYHHPTLLMSSKNQEGVTYLWMLGLIFLISLGIGKSLEVYSTKAQREQELRLIKIGKLYQQAIRDYYLSTPGPAKQYPTTLKQLLKDTRHLVLRRYIRKLYLDPITNKPFAVIRNAQDGVIGVESTSSKHPLNKHAIEGLNNASTAKQYREWEFLVD